MKAKFALDTSKFSNVFGLAVEESGRVDLWCHLRNFDQNQNFLQQEIVPKLIEQDIPVQAKATLYTQLIINERKLNLKK